MQELYNKAWESVRLASASKEGGVSWQVIVGIVAAVAIIAGIVIFVLYKKKMNKIKYE